MRPPARALPRLLTGLSAGRMTHAEHEAIHGELPVTTRAGRRREPELIGELERAGLVGHGGGAFPTAVKLRVVAQSRGRPIVLVNGCEGEPTSAKDHLLLARLPHLVLDGALLMARALEADEIAIAIEHEATRSVAAMDRAIGERPELERRGMSAYIVGVPSGYVTGQETAVISAINGGPAKPALTPPYPSDRGIGGRPTLVNNVETLANAALIARHGADWYRSIGTREHPGSRLITIGGAVGRPAVIEAASGTSLPSLIRAAGGLSERVQAFLLGGYAGTWVGPDSVAVSLEESELRKRGATLGAGLVFALPDSACPVAEVARVSRWLSHNSAGQCGPCTHGLDAIARALGGLCVPGDTSEAFNHVRRWCRMVAGRGACAMPDGAARFVASALRVFALDFDDHANNGPCEACSGPPVLPVPALEELYVT